MTDAAPRRTRLSKGRVRAVAWIAGGTTFLTGVGILGVAPKPATSGGTTARATAGRPDVIVRRVVRRVIVTDPAPAAAVRAIPVDAGGGAAGGATSPPAPEPATTTTGGS